MCPFNGCLHTSFFPGCPMFIQNRTDLHFNKPMGYDLRIPVWSDSPETDGYVYKKALEAVKKR